MASQEEKERVREVTDIVALVGETVVLQQRGSEFWGCCPFHHEKTPSMHVLPAQGLWKCFGCGRGGDCFSFVMERDNVEFPEALRTLADRAGVELSQDVDHRVAGSRKARLFEAVEEAVKFYNAQLTRVRAPGPERARAYLAARGMGIDVARAWRLGYAPGGEALVAKLLAAGFSRKEIVEAGLATDRGGRLRDYFYDRVLIPISNEQGRPVAFGGRILGDGEPKYLNTRETSLYHKSSVVFALDRAKASITARAEAIVVEGYFDAISMHQVGIDNVVAPCGTALTGRQIEAIARSLGSRGDIARGRIVLFQDADEAGLAASEKVFQHARSTTAPFYRAVLPDGKDPDEFLRGHGADDLREVLASPVPLARFVIDRHLARQDVSTPEGRALALADVTRAMGPIKGTALADDYGTYVAGRLGVDASTVRAALAQVRWSPPVERQDGLAPDEEGEPGPSRNATSGQGLPEPRLLPEDLRTLRVEREVLSAMAANPDAAREHAEQLSRVVWADPRDETIAWAMLATPAGSTSLQAISAAEAVVPDAVRVISEGDLAPSGEGEGSRALAILLDDLELRSLRRQIERGRGQLRVADVSQDPAGYDALFTEISELQLRLKELEGRVRNLK